MGASARPAKAPIPSHRFRRHSRAARLLAHRGCSGSFVGRGCGPLPASRVGRQRVFGAALVCLFFGLARVSRGIVSFLSCLPPDHTALYSVRAIPEFGSRWAQPSGSVVSGAGRPCDLGGVAAFSRRCILEKSAAMVFGSGRQGPLAHSLSADPPSPPILPDGTPTPRPPPARPARPAGPRRWASSVSQPLHASLCVLPSTTLAVECMGSCGRSAARRDTARRQCGRHPPGTPHGRVLALFGSRRAFCTVFESPSSAVFRTVLERHNVGHPSGQNVGPQ